LTANCEGIYKKRVGLCTFLFLLNTGNNQLVRLLENKRTSYNLHTNLKERDRLWQNCGGWM